MLKNLNSQQLPGPAPIDLGSHPRKRLPRSQYGKMDPLSLCRTKGDRSDPALKVQGCTGKFRAARAHFVIESENSRRGCGGPARPTP